tara:strand:+ start:336 stop:1631 length:1296 start_codon:yes stop_codon:yes gene_type:complete
MTDPVQLEPTTSLSSPEYDGCDYIQDKHLVYQRMADGGRFMNSSRDVTDRMLGLFKTSPRSSRERASDNVFTNSDVSYLRNISSTNPNSSRNNYNNSLNKEFNNGTTPWEKLDFVGGTPCKPHTDVDDFDYTLDWRFHPMTQVLEEDIKKFPPNWRGIFDKVQEVDTLTEAKIDDMAYDKSLKDFLKLLLARINFLNTQVVKDPPPPVSLNFAQLEIVRQSIDNNIVDIINSKNEYVGGNIIPSNILSEIQLMRDLGTRVMQYGDSIGKTMSYDKCLDYCYPKCEDGVIKTRQADSPLCNTCPPLERNFNPCSTVSALDLARDAEELWKKRSRNNRNNYMVTKSVDECQNLVESGNRYSVERRPIWDGGTYSSTGNIYYTDIFDPVYGPCRGYDEISRGTQQEPTNQGIQPIGNLWDLATEQFSLYPFRKN